ncbi:TPA: hypothetical protein ACH3X1_000823 [Trebouxia sp. C0004]
MMIGSASGMLPKLTQHPGIDTILYAGSDKLELLSSQTNVCIGELTCCWKIMRRQSAHRGCRSMSKSKYRGFFKGKQNVFVEEDKEELHSVHQHFLAALFIRCLQRLPLIAAVSEIYRAPSFCLPLFSWLQCGANLTYLIWSNAGMNAVLCWQYLTEQKTIESST